MSKDIFHTIHSDDWREMFRRHREQGAAEGNLVLAQIRAAVARQQQQPTYQRAAQGFCDFPGVELAPPVAISVHKTNEK